MLNEKAYTAIAELLQPYGEFLPCNLLGGRGYIFHCQNTKQIVDGKIQYRFGKSGLPAEMTALEFPGETDHVFKAQNLVTFDMFVSSVVVSAVEETGLKGFLFSENLAAWRP